ncbi:hypothetical protein BCR33DRAFT_718558 [Rhizoclosmatium globosum]|uniref:Uncharacterized protein n=1 Tax=Rhizoclosmatium globosum TaxID=329046 RepID=A0A1Y2C4S7_9FUNG|nr:hypothetical protein BCR33DRAFT_718558 [Rhizoclosmatium globosum]|eukprot:ORY41897.1 hypothetical protein BCR33DRAFT_718558 [Rhizoclosmatium globosum]
MLLIQFALFATLIHAFAAPPAVKSQGSKHTAPTGHKHHVKYIVSHPPKHHHSSHSETVHPTPTPTPSEHHSVYIITDWIPDETSALPSVTDTASTTPETTTTSTSTTETATTSTTTSNTETTTTSTSTSETTSSSTTTFTTFATTVDVKASSTCTNEVTVIVDEWIDDEIQAPTISSPSGILITGLDTGIAPVTSIGTDRTEAPTQSASISSSDEAGLDGICNPSTRLNCQSPLWCFRPPSADEPAPPGAYGFCKAPLVVPSPTDRFYIKSVDYNTCYNFESKAFEVCPSSLNPPDASFITMTILINPVFEEKSGRLLYEGGCFTVDSDTWTVSLKPCDLHQDPLAGQTFTAVIIPTAFHKNRLGREKVGLEKVFI